MRMVAWGGQSLWMLCSAVCWFREWKLLLASMSSTASVSSCRKNVHSMNGSLNTRYMSSIEMKGVSRNVLSDDDEYRFGYDSSHRYRWGKWKQRKRKAEMEGWNGELKRKAEMESWNGRLEPIQYKHRNTRALEDNFRPSKGTSQFSFGLLNGNHVVGVWYMKAHLYYGSIFPEL